MSEDTILTSPISQHAKAHNKTFNSKGKKKRTGKPPKTFSDKISLSWSDFQNQSGFGPMSIAITEIDTIEHFQLDDTFPFRISKPFSQIIVTSSSTELEERRHGTIGCFLVYMAFIKFAKQLWSTYSGEPKTNNFRYNVIRSIGTQLPRSLDAVLSDFENSDIKLGKAKVKWPMTTLRTLLLNAKRFAALAKSPTPFFDDEKALKNLFWDDREGRDKLDFHIKRYMSPINSEKYSNTAVVNGTEVKSLFFIPPLRKDWTDDELTAYFPSWYLDKDPIHVSVLNLFRLYSEIIPLNEDSQELFNLVGLTLRSETDQAICNEIDYEHDINKYLRVLSLFFEISSSPGTGTGYAP